MGPAVSSTSGRQPAEQRRKPTTSG